MTPLAPKTIADLGAGRTVIFGAPRWAPLDDATIAALRATWWALRRQGCRLPAEANVIVLIGGAP